MIQGQLIESQCRNISRGEGNNAVSTVSARAIAAVIRISDTEFLSTRQIANARFKFVAILRKLAWFFLYRAISSAVATRLAFSPAAMLFSFQVKHQRDSGRTAVGASCRLAHMSSHQEQNEEPHV